MKNPFFYKQNPLTQLLFLVLIVILGFFVFFAIGIITSLIMFPISLSDLAGGLDFDDPGMVPVLKNLQIWQSIGIFIVPSFIIAWFASPSPFAFLGFSKKVSLSPSVWVLLILLLAMPALNQLVIWNENMSLPGFLSALEEWMKEKEEMAAGLTNSFLLVDNFWGLMVNLLMIAIIPAFGEEIFFRGILQKLFGDWFKNGHVAVLLASILFSALHFQFYGFFPRFVLGLIFGYMFLWSGNIWYPIIAHLFNNTMPVVAFYIMGEEAMEGIDQLGTGQMSWIWVTASVIFTGFAIFLFRKLTNKTINSNI